jgi:hypothetical protein
MNQFADPASAASLDLKTLLGNLLLVEPHEVATGIPTVHGPSDAIRADVTVLDGPTAGAVATDTLIWPKVLISQLRSRVGQMVLGRLGQGVAKPGQSAPWTLIAATEQDKATAGAYLAQRPAPAPATPQPTASPWNATPAATAPAASPWTAAPAAGAVAAPPF